MKKGNRETGRTQCAPYRLLNGLRIDGTHGHFHEIFREDDVAAENARGFGHEAFTDAGWFQLFGDVSQDKGADVRFRGRIPPRRS